MGELPSMQRTWLRYDMGGWPSQQRRRTCSYSIVKSFLNSAQCQRCSCSMFTLLLRVDCQNNTYLSDVETEDLQYVTE